MRPVQVTKLEFLNCLNANQLKKYNYAFVPAVLTGKNTKIKIFCNDCGVYFEQNFYSHKNGNGCRKCQYKTLSEKLKKSFDEFVESAKNIHGEAYTYFDNNYIKNNVKIGIMCNVCGTKFHQTPGNHIMGHGCPSEICVSEKISSKNKISKTEFIEQSKTIFGDAFTYHNYDGKHGKIEIRCLVCDHMFFRNGRDHLNSLGCPNCSTDKSLGEKIIRQYLDGLNIFYEREKTFSDLRGISKYAILKFDFYLQEYNLVIEFDGIHHFVYYSFSNKNKLTETEKTMEIQRRQRNDRIKDEYCHLKGIKMMRIKYTENIEDRLNAEFKKS